MLGRNEYVEIPRHGLLLLFIKIKMRMRKELKGI
jgi:hypothetical protein